MNRYITKIARAATRYSGNSLGEDSISDTEYECLHLIRKNDGVNQTFLSKKLHVDKSMITRIIAALESKGLVERVRSTSDGRAFSLHATKKAWELRDRIRSAESSFYDWLTEEVPDEKLEVFNEVLQQLYEKSKNERACDYANFNRWLDYSTNS